MTSDHVEPRSRGDGLTGVVPILLFFGCLGMGGAAVIRLQRGEFVAGWAIAAGAISLVFVAAPHLGRVLPGIFGVAALNSFVTLLSGHLLTKTSRPFPRVVSGTCVVLFLVTAVLSKRFEQSRTLITDRLAIAGAMASALIGTMSDSFILPAAVAMLCCIGGARLIAGPGSTRRRSAS